MIFLGRQILIPPPHACSRHYCCRNVVHSLTIAYSVEKKKIYIHIYIYSNAVSLPYRLFTLCDLSSCIKRKGTKESLRGGKRPQRHFSPCHSLFIIHVGFKRLPSSVNAIANVSATLSPPLVLLTLTSLRNNSQRKGLKANKMEIGIQNATLKLG